MSEPRKVNETAARMIRITTKDPSELDAKGWVLIVSDYRSAVRHIAEACRSGLVVSNVETNF